MPKEKMLLKTYDWDTAINGLSVRPVDMVWDMPQTEENTGKPPVKSYGMPITVKAFQEMIRKYQEAAAGDPSVFSKIIHVTFSKSSIFRILSQEGCEGIRIWSAIPGADGKISLVLEGVDQNNQPIKMANVLRTAETDGTERDHDPEDPFYEERGNGDDDGGLLSKLTGEEIKSKDLPGFMGDMFSAFSTK